MRRFVVAVLLAAAAHAQQNTPHAGYVYPAGGRQGTAFEVRVGGQFLDGVTALLVSGPGIETKVVELVKPLTPAQANALREEFMKIPDKRSARAVEIRAKLAAFVRRQSSPAIAETVRASISIAPDAAPGRRELRLLTRTGLTNPLVFEVGRLPEVTAAPLAAPDVVAARPPHPPAAITLPVMLNGQAAPGSADSYRFTARRGSHIVAAAGARELIPYISDAVPGWFQVALTISDAQGREVAHADHYLFHQDPVLLFEPPEDGEYVLAVRDSIYRGRQDFVYRVSIGELPFVTAAFPLGGKSGSKTAVELAGWNLPAAKITESLKGRAAGVWALPVAGAPSFQAQTMNERMEKEPNDEPKSAQKIKLPVVLNGRIGRSGDEDVFRFDGRAGQRIAAEVTARRLGSPLDSLLRLTDASGREIAANDDFEDRGAGLLTHQADSRILATLPKKGAYYLRIADTQGNGGTEYAYRLRVSEPRPDFELRVAPSAVNLRAGTAAPVTVYAIRKDGFSGEIALALKDAPTGFAISGGLIPAGEDKVRLTLTASGNAPADPMPLHLEGRASIGGKETVRPGVPAEDMMQAFAYHHLVPAEQWLARVIPAPRNRAVWRLLEEKPVVLAPGRTATVRFFMPLGQFFSQVHFALSDAPEGIVIESVEPERTGISILLRTDPAKLKSGAAGNLLIEAAIERTVSNGSRSVKRRVPYGFLPAAPYRVAR